MVSHLTLGCWLALAACSLVATMGACGGSVGLDSNGGPGANDAGTAETSTRDSGRPAACPSTPPSSGTPCSPAGIECEYTSEVEACGKYTCSKAIWNRSFASGGGCTPPADLVCPIPQAPLVGGPKATIDKSCDGRDDCVVVTLQTDCCGNSLAYAVNKKSAVATRSYADACARTFPGCGCPARPTVPEQGEYDGGIGTEPKIIATCAGPNGCVSTYAK